MNRDETVLNFAVPPKFSLKLHLINGKWTGNPYLIQDSCSRATFMIRVPGSFPPPDPRLGGPSIHYSLVHRIEWLKS